MAKITRAFQKIFADGITPTGNIAVFGSLAAGSPAYSKDPVAIQSLSQWSQGWGPSIIGNQSPALEDFNAYQYLISRQIAYLLQAGIAEWEATTVYYTGSFCAVAGVIYRSKTDANQGNAVSDIVNWEVLLSTVATSGSYADLTNKPTGQLAAAWVNFQGNGAVGNQTIRSSSNVTSVNKTATGRYTLTFTTALANANYLMVGTASTSTPNNYALCLAEAISASAYVSKTTTELAIACKRGRDDDPNDCFSGNVVIYAV